MDEIDSDDGIMMMVMVLMMMVLAMMMPTKGISVMSLMRLGYSSATLKIQNSFFLHDRSRGGKASSVHTCFSEFILNAHFWDFESHLLDHHVSSHPAALKFRRGEEIQME